MASGVRAAVRAELWLGGMAADLARWVTTAFVTMAVEERH